MADIIKLVRDKIPRIFPHGQVRYVTLTFGGKDHQRYLRKKLMEEVEEYLEDRTVSEIVDIIEACFALAYVCHGVDSGELERMAIRKRNQRGTFYDPVVIVMEDPTYDRHSAS